MDVADVVGGASRRRLGAAVRQGLLVAVAPVQVEPQQCSRPIPVGGYDLGADQGVGEDGGVLARNETGQRLASAVVQRRSRRHGAGAAVAVTAVAAVVPVPAVVPEAVTSADAVAGDGVAVAVGGAGTALDGVNVAGTGVLAVTASRSATIARPAAMRVSRAATFPEVVATSASACAAAACVAVTRARSAGADVAAVTGVAVADGTAPVVVAGVGTDGGGGVRRGARRGHRGAQGAQVFAMQFGRGGEQTRHRAHRGRRGDRRKQAGRVVEQSPGRAGGPCCRDLIGGRRRRVAQDRATGTAGRAADPPPVPPASNRPPDRSAGRLRLRPGPLAASRGQRPGLPPGPRRAGPRKVVGSVGRGGGREGGGVGGTGPEEPTVAHRTPQGMIARADRPGSTGRLANRTTDVVPVWRPPTRSASARSEQAA